MAVKRHANWQKGGQVRAQYRLEHSFYNISTIIYISISAVASCPMHTLYTWVKPHIECMLMHPSLQARFTAANTVE